MKVLVVLFAVLALTCAKLNWPKVHILEPPSELEPRIAGGAPAAPHEFPYQIGLYMKHRPLFEGDPRQLLSLCGGSLISDSVILTAAHCLTKSDVGLAIIGSHKLLSGDKSERQVIRIIKSDWVIHPDYDPIRSKNDIAIIKLPKPAILNDNVKVINLPKRSQEYADIQGRYAIASGWGRTGDNAGASSVLRFASLRILSPAVCRVHFSILFTETNICVNGADYKSVCQGDSGGPLAVTELNGEKTLIGLTSFGHKKGCEKGYPTVFTRVSSYLDWISSETGVKIKN